MQNPPRSAGGELAEAAALPAAQAWRLGFAASKGPEQDRMCKLAAWVQRNSDGVLKSPYRILVGSAAEAM